ncbi:MAG: cytochrome c oxidase subunit 3 [Pseudomonadota bacterium]|uniref:cytochrome c oxidase subunit 3 n=1 Tax=Phenylobacterium sp. TaxID=1871053 RepID=UPI0025E6AC20|nr:cytochrome c oxidase subunit 3 [Phenylobacterium sp.]MBT9471667.1 cytochrome c oxidase subunit 3 [Phenylobacterium sp.]
MSILRRLSEKPWLAPGVDPLTEADAESLPSLSSAAVGLRVYFGVATVMFLLIAVIFVMRMDGHGVSTGQQPDWKPMFWPPLLWFNTGVLMLSSAAWQWARAAGHRGHMESLRAGLIAGGVLALVFLAGQLTVWRQLEAAGCGMTATTMSAFFYLITALHGLHLLGGLAVWGRTSVKVLGGSEVAEVRQSVDLCAIYWHFLLLVWLVMFGLLLLNRR